MNKLIVLLSLIISGNVLADQCAYITKKQAQKAVKRLIKAESIETLCEPCGETISQRVEIESVTFANTGYQNYYEVSVNGKGIDLAYTFLKGKNLAKSVRCETTGVSSRI